jgi:histone acetyltransferase (RNA polymerase elongator complex component)
MAAIIPFFIQHRGCPHRCLFCDQTAITGAEAGAFHGHGEMLRETIELWLSRFENRTQIQFAFYGGSFTCLPEAVQIQLLNSVRPYLEAGKIESLRLSTRPDCINGEICELLWDSGVRTVELGVQSMNDAVLELSERGHDAADVRLAASLLKQYGFSLGVQLMPGLPGDTTGSFIQTVQDVIELDPDFVRIYPALVIRNTGLEQLYKSSRYRPLSMNRAVALTSRARQLFLKRNIAVIRMGLQPSAELEHNIIAGPYHQAFGEMVVSRNWFRRIRQLFSRVKDDGTIVVTISDRDYSSFVGLKRSNIKRLKQLFPQCRLEVKTDKSMERGQVHYVVS